MRTTVLVALLLAAQSSDLFAAQSNDLRAASPGREYGEKQVADLFQDRPAVERALESRPAVRDWIVERFARTVPPIDWDPSLPVSGRRGEFDPTDPEVTRVRVNPDLPGIDQLCVLLFELHNIGRYDEFTKIHDRAVLGELSREDYARLMLEEEFVALRRARAFFADHLDDLSPRERDESKVYERLRYGPDDLQGHIRQFLDDGFDLRDHFRVLYETDVVAERVARATSGNRVETEHLVIAWQDGVGDEAVERARSEGERCYSAIRDLLGHEPGEKVTILLLGSAERPGGVWGYPKVDPDGRIHLYRFSPGSESYFHPLARQMTHVFRFDRRAAADSFFEEGFADFVSLRVDPSPGGFPWYGFPVAVVAGQWIAGGEGIPLATLREKHRTLIIRCKAQGFALRAAFFHWLGETFGDDALVAMAQLDHPPRDEDYVRYFGKDFASLAADQEASLMNEFDSIEGAEEAAAEFRRSPIRYMTVCRDGEGL